jgi:hypothetical protein
MMIPIKVYDNMNNWKFDNVNFAYGFKFYVCMLSKTITSVIVKIIHIFMFSPCSDMSITCRHILLIIFATTL